MFFGGSGEEGSDGLNGVSTLANNFWKIGFAGCHKKRGLAVQFRAGDHQFIGEFYKLPQHKSEKLLHDRLSAQAVASATCLRALLMMLPTVCEGRAPTPTQ